MLDPTVSIMQLNSIRHETDNKKMGCTATLLQLDDWMTLTLTLSVFIIKPVVTAAANTHTMCLTLFSVLVVCMSSPPDSDAHPMVFWWSWLEWHPVQCSIQKKDAVWGLIIYKCLASWGSWDFQWTARQHASCYCFRLLDINFYSNYWGKLLRYSLTTWGLGQVTCWFQIKDNLTVIV